MIGINKNTCTHKNICTRCQKVWVRCVQWCQLPFGKNCFFQVSVMPSYKNNKWTGGSISNQGNQRQACSGDSKVSGASTTTPCSKKKRVQPPLAKDDIPAIVKAIRTLLLASVSLPTSTTNGDPGTSLSSQRLSLPSGTTSTTEGHESSTISRQHESGHEGSLSIDPGE